VWQWTADCYVAKFYLGRPNPDNDPVSSCATTTMPVIRGGSYFDDPFFARSASRSYGWSADYRYPDIGFRIVSGS